MRRQRAAEANLGTEDVTIRVEHSVESLPLSGFGGLSQGCGDGGGEARVKLHGVDDAQNRRIEINATLREHEARGDHDGLLGRRGLVARGFGVVRVSRDAG